MALAETFGAEGYQIALVARNQAKLDGLVQDLGARGITAAGFEADLANPAEIASAFAAIRERFGSVDVLEYSPVPALTDVEDALNVSVEGVKKQFDLLTLVAVAAVREVLPGMLEKGDGALLFTTGGAAQHPVPIYGNVSVALGGLRHYFTNLNTVLQPKGIYVGSVCIYAMVTPDGAVTPTMVAETYREMVEKRDQLEVVLSDPALNRSAFVTPAAAAS
jgi:short-subunit dehydrogenase